MLRLLKLPHNGGAKDGKFGMSLGMSRTVVGVERMAVGRVARPQSLAAARIADGHVAGKWSAYGDHLAASRGGSATTIKTIITS